MVTTATYAIASGTTFDADENIYKEFMTLSNGKYCLSAWSCTSFKLVQKKNTEGYCDIHLWQGIRTSALAHYLDLVSTQQTVTVPAMSKSSTDGPFKYSAKGVHPFDISITAPASKMASKITFTFTFSPLFQCTMLNAPNGNAQAVRSDSGYVRGSSIGNTMKICEEDTVRLTPFPDANYKFVEWKILPNVVVANNTFLMPSTNITVSPIFERYIFDISIQQTQLGTASASTYSSIEGNTITLTAYPDTGYQLLRWDSSPYIEITNNSFSMPGEDVIITPVFKKISSDIHAGYYNGTSYLPSVPMYYNGTNWIECDWKYYDGTNWLDANAT